MRVLDIRGGGTCTFVRSVRLDDDRSRLAERQAALAAFDVHVVDPGLRRREVGFISVARRTGRYPILPESWRQHRHHANIAPPAHGLTRTGLDQLKPYRRRLARASRARFRGSDHFE